MTPRHRTIYYYWMVIIPTIWAAVGGTFAYTAITGQIISATIILALILPLAIWTNQILNYLITEVRHDIKAEKNKQSP